MLNSGDKFQQEERGDICVNVQIYSLYSCDPYLIADIMRKRTGGFRVIHWLVLQISQASQGDVL